MAKNKSEKRMLGSIITMFIIILLIMITSSILSLSNVEGQKTAIVGGTLETSLITVQNLLTVEGIQYLFRTILSNFRVFEPLVLILISLIGVSICEASGLFKAISNPLRKRKGYIVTGITLFVGIISSFIGMYSYVLLIPMVAIIYRYLGRNSLLGIFTVFLGITVGYGAGFFYNYDDFLLGTLTQAAAIVDVDKNYKFILESNLYIMIASTIILTIFGTKVIDSFLAPKFSKKVSYEDELIVSKKAFFGTLIAFGLLFLFFLYMIIPGMNGSGFLLDNSSERYIAKLFSEVAPFSDGLLFIIMIIMVVCGLVYGKLSGNFKKEISYHAIFSRGFGNLGYLFVMLFLSSIMINLFTWSNMGEIITVHLVDFLSGLQFSGIPLILVMFVLVIIISIFVPSTETKWILLSPLVIPLFMKSNITPDFTQFIFKAADGLGKCLTPLFVYFIVMQGFLEKYVSEDENLSIFASIKLLLKPYLLFVLIWMIILSGWYLIGLPIGIGSFPTL